MRVLVFAVSLLAAAMEAAAQAPPASSPGFAVRGYGLAGVHAFSASQTFTAVTGSGSGPVYGGGLRVHLPGGAYLDVGAWRYAADGQRVFISTSREVFDLGIPVTVRVTPLELTAGWRFAGLVRRVTPHVGVGYTSLAYEETGDFADSGDDVSERFGGFHVVAGAEVRLHRWIGLIAEGAWTSVKDGFGDAGASKAFGEDNLGGTTVRLKLVVGR